MRTPDEAHLNRGLFGAAVSWLLGGALLGPIMTFLASIVIVAGPWLFSILTLAVVSLRMEPILGREVVEDLRLTVIYSLLIAPLIAGPLGAVSARLVRDAVEQDSLRQVPGLILVSLGLSGILTLALSALVAFALGISGIQSGLAFVALSVATAVLWNSLSVLSALRTHAFMIGSFVSGIFVSLCIVLMVGLRSEPHTIIWVFVCGIVFSVAVVTARVVDSNKPTEKELREAAASLAQEIVRSRFLILGIVFSFFGVWVDKWVLWLGPSGERSINGFLHASTYDSVMFLAHLSIIPSFAAMYLLHERVIRKEMIAFRGVFSRGDNHTSIREAVSTLGNNTWSGILIILFVQGTLTATLVLVAPILSRFMHFDFSQFILLRVGLVAVFVHAVFYMCSAVLLVCGRYRQFFAVQCVFFLINLVASWVWFVQVGESAYGIFTASLAAAVMALVLAHNALNRIDFVTFVGENRSLFR